MPRVPISTSRGFSGIFSLPSDETTSGNFRSMGFLRKKSTSPFMAGFFQVFFKILLGQWLNFGKLVGSTYLVGENADMQFKLLFQGPGRLSEVGYHVQGGTPKKFQRWPNTHWRWSV